MKKRAGMIFLVMLVLAVLAGCGPKPAASAGSVDIFNPWVRVSAAGGSTAAYMTLKNGAGQADKLLTAEFAGAGMVEVMNTSIIDDKMTMETIPAIELPANGEVELKPGGYHVMLMNLNQDLIEGENATVTLIFENAGRVTVEMPIQKTP